MPPTTVTLDRLHDMLAELDASIAALRGESSDRGHPADAGSALVEADRTHATLDAMTRQRRAVEAALRRVVDGTYGTCVTCARPVPAGRLEARPEAARCVPCQAKYDRLNR
ncbi:TraR/DksA family transcriptional regulator [Actinocorallia longicatena]|uniref:TraR/DksA family transcriptional regulator n=1 Tax=Actinocorallia longicatena TaxID=111803 RepID=UPI0031CEDAF1